MKEITRSSTTQDVLVLKDLRFGWPSQTHGVLGIDTLTMTRSEAVFLHGPSGSGKSTLLAAIAGVVETSPGMVSLAGHDMGAQRAATRDRLRADHLGILFQMFNLVPYLSVLDNVLLPCQFSSRRRDRAGGVDAPDSARRLLEGFGLGGDEMHRRRPSDLSVGQQQRVAAARALIGAPDLVLADEPTSALDSDLKAGFVDLFMRECASNGAALLFVSHDRPLASHFDRTLDFAELNKAFGQEAA